MRIYTRCFALLITHRKEENVFSRKLYNARSDGNSRSTMTDQLKSEKSVVVSLPKNKPKKWIKILSVVDKIAIALAISLGIAAFLTTDNAKTLYMALGIIPAFYLAYRGFYFLRAAKRCDETLNPLKNTKLIQHWIGLIINSVAVIVNFIVVIVRIFWL